MIAQEPQLVAWAEKHESAIPEGTLGRWTIEHMLTLLARGEDDTPAVKAAIEQILASPKEPAGMVELKVLQANITSYRAEVRRWVTDQTAQVACLQETHIIPAKDQEIKASWNTPAKQVSTTPAAVTQGEIRQGSQGGLMMVSANHINLRQLTGWESAGKGFQLSVIRLRGIDLCVGNVYMESGVGPAQGVNPELLTRLATAILEAGIPFLIAGDWNCQPGDLSSVMFPSRIGGHVLFPTGAHHLYCCLPSKAPANHDVQSCLGHAFSTACSCTIHPATCSCPPPCASSALLQQGNSCHYHSH